MGLVTEWGCTAQRSYSTGCPVDRQLTKTTSADFNPARPPARELRWNWRKTLAETQWGFGFSAYEDRKGARSQLKRFFDRDRPPGRTAHGVPEGGSCSPEEEPNGPKKGGKTHDPNERYRR